ncbi:hypothetical protein ECA96_23945 [Salmonella enterica subsp. enterica]|nr:hypothetical protein [Salmonella enterica subsp. enterica serovar Enteritidis]EBZ5729813.1 hypothetical protein [Salmonella enterica subsp. enterica serovar Enteritidis]EBZ8078914.1 hypothetical protein [Salmonella enterica subsp. enterica serovar Enteritidis]
MVVFKYIRAAINFYLLYIQPMLGLFLISIGLWGFYAPDEGTCTNLNIELCAVSAIDILKPAIFVLLGVITVTGWYFTELQPRLRGEGKYMKVKTGVKPEDFVK